MKLCYGYFWSVCYLPKPNDEPIQINIPDCSSSYTQSISYIGKEALQAVTSGIITPDEAGRVASLIGANARLIALAELNQRIDALKENKDQ